MLEYISYFQILGKPLIFHLGILSFILLIATASISIFGMKLKIRNSFKLHKLLALITIVVVTIHGLLGILLYF